MSVIDNMPMKRTDIDIFEKLMAQLGGLYQEMSALAKKSPNDAVNIFKLQFVNGCLGKCNELLGQRYRPFSEFEVFSSEDMPSNSDVTFILSQYIACADKLRADNIFHRHGKWFWNIDGVSPEAREGRIETPPPKKLATQVSNNNARKQR